MGRGISLDELDHDTRQLRAAVLLHEVPRAANRGMWLTGRTRHTLPKARSRPRVIGSPSLNAVRKGLSHCRSTFQACRFAGAAGSFGWVGTSSGNARDPALYAPLGNGASYAAITSRGRRVRQPTRTIWPTGN